MNKAIERDHLLKIDSNDLGSSGQQIRINSKSAIQQSKNNGPIKNKGGLLSK